MATLSDVARRAGVSVSVVSRVLNEDSSLRARPETRLRVRQAAKDLQYWPNQAARALQSARAGAIGLIVPDVTNAVFAELLRGVEAQADAAALQVVLGRSERMKPGSPYLRRLLAEGRVDGFIIQHRDDLDAALIDKMSEPGVPQVHVNSRGTGHPSIGSVVLDDEGAAAAATEHLLRLGHRHIAFVGGDPRSYTSRSRERGYRNTMKANAAKVRSAWVVRGGYTAGAGRSALAAIADLPGAMPTALLVANVNTAVGVLSAARMIGLQIPQDVSIVAIHDSWMAEFSAPPLTVIRMPLYELGRAAMTSLSARLGSGQVLDITVSQPAPQLIVRESTAGPPPPMRRTNHRSIPSPWPNTNRPPTYPPSSK